MNHPSFYHRSIRFPSGDRFWNCQADTFLHDLPIAIMYSGLSRWGPGRQFERHTSDVFSVELVTAGNIELMQDSHASLVGPGEAFILRKGGRHRFTTGPAGFAHKRMAIIDGILLDIVLKSLQIDQHDTIRLDNPDRLVGLIKETYHLMGNRSSDYIWRLSGIAYEILLELGRNVLYRDIPREVALALDYMNLHVQSGDITLKELADRSGVSMYHFSRLFSKSMGSSPMTFFHRQKVTLAKNLLSNTQLLVKEIAALLGFDDPFYFSAQFRKHVGMSPREYRRQNGGGWDAPKGKEEAKE